jgi:DNA ligase D-like protein (predicted 3'-phosphoesterase)
MSDASKLKKYRSKRDVEKTGEPEGSDAGKSADPVFVVQKHDASRLHYDFRLEIDGVLKSWAIPKGPSTDPRVKRLAIPTEDHPLEYATFEGVIPEENYGGGTVLVWDRGTYDNLRKDQDGRKVDMSRCFTDGHLAVWLNGEKITGGYALIRKDGGEEERWLLVKMDDENADARRNPVSTEQLSVASGRNLDEIAAEERSK